MGRRVADRPVDHIPPVAMSRAIGDAHQSLYRQGMLMAMNVCATAGKFYNEAERDLYLNEMIDSLPVPLKGEHKDDYTWGFYQMMEILHGSLTNLSGPELLHRPS